MASGVSLNVDIDDAEPNDGNCCIAAPWGCPTAPCLGSVIELWRRQLLIAMTRRSGLESRATGHLEDETPSASVPGESPAYFNRSIVHCPCDGLAAQD